MLSHDGRDKGVHSSLFYEDTNLTAKGSISEYYYIATKLSIRFSHVKFRGILTFKSIPNISQYHVMEGTR